VNQYFNPNSATTAALTIASRSSAPSWDLAARSIASTACFVRGIVRAVRPEVTATQTNPSRIGFLWVRSSAASRRSNRRKRFRKA